MELAASMAPLSTATLSQPHYRLAAPLPRMRSSGFASTLRDHTPGMTLLGNWTVPLGSIAAVAAVQAGRRARQTRKVVRHVVGPQVPAQKLQAEVVKEQVGARVAYMLLNEKGGITRNLEQYGYCQIDGFLGGDNGHAQIIRDEMKKLFDRGWFESETESFTKVGPFNINYDDLENRFRYQVKSTSTDTGMEGERNQRLVDDQFDIAPNALNFVRAFLSSAHTSMSGVMNCQISKLADVEMRVLCGQGSHYSRRAENHYGWNTREGWVPDGRKLCVFYFLNPNYNEDQGGHLQLEGVKTPTGTVSISPVHDRLVIFTSEKVVWSTRPSYADRISDHQYQIVMRLMASDPLRHMDYDPHHLAKFFPELQGQDVSVPPIEMIPGINEMYRDGTM